MEYCCITKYNLEGFSNPTTLYGVDFIHHRSLESVGEENRDSFYFHTGHLPAIGN